MRGILCTSTSACRFPVQVHMSQRDHEAPHEQKSVDVLTPEYITHEKG